MPGPNPTIPGDPGEGSSQSGSPILPWTLTEGELIVLRVEGINGPLPNDPFIIRKSIETFVGGKIESGCPESKGTTYALNVRSIQQATKLMKMTELCDKTPIKIYTHPTLNTIRCVINNSSTINKTEKELENELSSQRVMKVKRITRKVSGLDVNTSTIILTLQGTSLPRHIQMGFELCTPRHYYPAPMLCFQCWTFGHTKLRCPQKTAICGNCGKNAHTAQGERCSEESFCNRCSSNAHSLSSRNCPVYVKEDAIQHIKVDQGIAYPAARRIYESSRNSKSYASVTASSSPANIDESTGHENAMKNLSAKMDTLLDELMKRDKRLEALEQRENTGERGQSIELQQLNEKLNKLLEDNRRKDERISTLEAETAATVTRLRNALKTKEEEVTKLKATIRQIQEIGTFEAEPEDMDQTPQGTNPKTADKRKKGKKKQDTTSKHKPATTENSEDSESSLRNSLTTHDNKRLRKQPENTTNNPPNNNTGDYNLRQRKLPDPNTPNQTDSYIFDVLEDVEIVE